MFQIGVFLKVHPTSEQIARLIIDGGFRKVHKHNFFQIKCFSYSYTVSDQIVKITYCVWWYTAAFADIPRTASVKVAWFWTQCMYAFHYSFAFMTISLLVTFRLAKFFSIVNLSLYTCAFLRCTFVQLYLFKFPIEFIAYKKQTRVWTIIWCLQAIVRLNHMCVVHLVISVCLA